MKKMSGLEYKQFMNADWDSLFKLNHAYVDDSAVTVDGVDEPFDVNAIADNANVVIHSGCIMADEDVDLSFETAFARWKKVQTHTVRVVSIKNSRLEEFDQYVKGLA